MGAYSNPTELEALRVHVANPEDLRPAAPRRKRYRTVFETIVLTAADPIKQILPASDTREIAYIMSPDNDIVIGKDNATVQAQANTSGSPATPAFPSGTLIPKSLTVPWPVQESTAVLAGATNLTANSRITITAVHCDE